MVSHVELGHSDPARMIDSHRLIIATAKTFSCTACEDSQRWRLHPVAGRVLHELGTCLQVDQFDWRDPVFHLLELGTIMVCRRGLTAKSIRVDFDPGEASWKTSELGKHWISLSKQQYV